MTYPSGRTVSWDYDVAGRAVSVTGSMGGTLAVYANGITCAPHGAVSSMSIANGARTEQWCYNNRMQPVGIRLGPSSAATCDAQAGDLLRLTFGYGPAANNNGNILSQTIARPTANFNSTETYTYDSLNRLKTGTGTGWAQTYVFDRYGNRALLGTSTIPDAVQSPVVSSETESAVQAIFPSNRWSGGSYDTAGNQLSRYAGSFTYDAENRLKTSTINSVTTTYAYDGEGRRVKKGNEIFVYDAFGNLAAEYGGTPTPVGTQYITTDHLGSTRLITKQDGTVDRCIDYFPFGETIPAGTGSRPACYGASVQPVSLFQNSFAPPPPGAFVGLNPGAMLGPWLVGGDGIDHIGAYWQSADGDQASIDLSGTGPGSITTSLSTLSGWTTGATYRVSFSLAANPDNTLSPQSCVRATTASSQQDYCFNVLNVDGQGTQASTANMGWQRHTFEFTGAPTDHLTFTSLDAPGDGWGPALDNITVEKLVPTTGTGVRHLFTGKERDTETNLDYFGARYLSAAQGRFTSADAPFADQFPENPQTWNLYSYVRNNPLRYIDEDGRGAKEFFFGLVNAVSSNAGATQRSRSSHPHVRMGQRLGDGLSIAGGFVEMAGGATITGTGAGACGTGVLCVAGAPAIAAGVSIAGHGAMMTGNALASFMSASEEAPESSGGGPAQDGGPKATDAKGTTAAGQATNQYGQKLGPSGKPVIHNVDHPTKKSAKDAARNAGKGTPIQHPSPTRGKPHYHPTDRRGKKLPDGTHHNYPE